MKFKTFVLLVIIGLCISIGTVSGVDEMTGGTETANTNAKLLQSASNDKILFDSEPIYVGSYNVEGNEYYVVEYKNPIAGGYSIFGSDYIRVKDKNICEKVITAMYITHTTISEFDDFSNNLKNNKNIIDELQKVSTTSYAKLNAVTSAADIKEYASTSEHNELMDAGDKLNEINSASQSTISYANALSSSMSSLMNNRDYDNAKNVVDMYKNYTDSLNKLNKDVQTMKSKTESIDRTLRKIDTAAFGKSPTLRTIISEAATATQSLDYTIDAYTENSKNMSYAGILKVPSKNIDPEIKNEVSKFNTRLNPNSKLLLFAIAIVFILVLIAGGVMLIQHRREKMEEKLITDGHIEGSGTLNVSVVEAGTRMPISNAKVVLISEKKNILMELITDCTGVAAFPDTSSGRYTLDVSTENHNPTVTEVHISPGYNSSRIILNPKA